jgi:mono/diheme cytochrome c family protein
MPVSTHLPLRCVFAVALLTSVTLSCSSRESYPDDLWQAQHAPPETMPAAGGCRQARGQPLPARIVAMSAGARTGSSLVFVTDLFQRFSSVCGACHGPSVDPPGLGSFQIASADDFPALMTPAVLAHVTSDETAPRGDPTTDPLDPMPPPSNGGRPYSQRTDADPVKQLAVLVQTWFDAGKPKSFSAPAAQAGAGGGPSKSYTLSAAAGIDMTNIGNCVPDASLVAVEQEESTLLDAKFAASMRAAPTPDATAAQMIGLPERLGDTDLTTFDSAALAEYGVVAYAPAYPNWSDDAGKVRHVRVPRGTSIHFNKATQEFDIPPNTRFYQTSLKAVVDTDGTIRYRKMETRLIVARPDSGNGSANVGSGPCPRCTALYGTYQWNDSETDAVLVQTPLNDGEPFADTLVQYVSDEPLAADVLKGSPFDPDEALSEAHAAKHHAIPSSERCVQCHMGSPSQSFVLGFRPVQINRRPAGTGGIIDAAGEDELTQLQRLIDYGIVTGIDSLADVLPLEQSEGARAPRNDYELAAQGYMLGNCAHCHNPRGFPSVQYPVLQDVLSFLPGPAGGIFQFPLEKFSPRIPRGNGGSMPIAYITPSLVDLPPQGGADYVAKAKGTPGPGGSYDVVLYAPWRSLIYRNVDTPFTYADDLALYPHMPMNTPGFDPRARQIMSDWMVSIPALRKHPDIPEYNIGVGTGVLGTSSQVDDEPQPYVEVQPGDPEYAVAVATASQRLSILHSGSSPAVSTQVVESRYADLGDTFDILDPQVLQDAVCHPVPTPSLGTEQFPNPLQGAAGDGVPGHAHWVITDLTDPQGDWEPRQANWMEVLVRQQFPDAASATCGTLQQDAQDALDAQEVAVGLLESVTLDRAMRDFATRQLPYGVWKPNSACNFASVPKVSSVQAQPGWYARWAQDGLADGTVAPGAPVYMQSPGEAIFDMICINCHGSDATGHGRMADNLLVMTGGNTRVANLRDGLFGPKGHAGANNQRVFGGPMPSDLAPDVLAAWTSTTAEDRGARYLSWMSLGGTDNTIPASVLGIVGTTEVLGVGRRLPMGTKPSANMLSVAESLCYSLLVGDTTYNDERETQFDPRSSIFDYSRAEPFLKKFHSLVRVNGDAELWMRLCSIDNPPPVRAIVFDDNTKPGSLQLALTNGCPRTCYGAQCGSTPCSDNGVTYSKYFDPAAYGQNPVGSDKGNDGKPYEVGISPDNLFPWCLEIPGAHDASNPAFAVYQEHFSGVPVCPFPVDYLNDSASSGVAVNPPGDPSCKQNCQCQNHCLGADSLKKWATRGAINAGLAVYLYLDALAHGTMQPQAPYDECAAIP